MTDATIDPGEGVSTRGLAIDERDGGLLVRLSGSWTLSQVLGLDGPLRTLAERQARQVTFDASSVTGLDSAGAWVIRRTLGRLGDRGVAVGIEGLPERFHPILEKARIGDRSVPMEPETPNAVVAVLERAGRATVEGLVVGERLLNFLGYALTALGGTILRPRRLRFTATVAQIEATGVNALPIVGLLCFLVGVVLAYMGALQLEKFGAKVLTVNLVGVSVLREIGGLLAAIIVAGRSGSAFAAQIGTMKVNQEVDALETMGLSAVDVLVLPRLIALVIALPALTVFADVAGLAGGAVVSLFLLDMSLGQFLSQLSGAVQFWDVATGLIKAPVFAAVIALVGCYDGLKVSGSAESVGRQTTRAVVESIFLVIVLDAAFAVAFAEIGI